MNIILKSVIRPFFRFYKIASKLNILKTIYINFRKLPLTQAIILPIYVYKGLKISSLKGEIIIDYPIESGIIKIGHDVDSTPLSSLRTKIEVRGKLTFKGFAIIGKGTVITVDGEMTIGNCCMIGSGNNLKSLVDISIGDNSRITSGCSIMDCDMHYVKNIENGIVKRNRAAIRIGKNCWLNSGTIVGKGVILPDYCITAKNTFLGKDYSLFGNNLFLAGSPAKIINTHVQRIFSSTEQARLNTYFRNNPTVEEIELEKGLFNDINNEEYFRWLV
jgi:acetyltransferase-like isoleucine patch superfamily enzyme